MLTSQTITAHTVPDRPARGHRSRAGPSHPGTSGRAGASRRTRRGSCRGGPAADQLVPPGTGQKRSGLRLAEPEVASLEASSGQRTRHRLDRDGDRALNRALHSRDHAPPVPRETRAYEARRTLQGKTRRHIRCCLKCTLARHLYRVMESTAAKSPASAAKLGVDEI